MRYIIFDFFGTEPLTIKKDDDSGKVLTFGSIIEAERYAKEELQAGLWVVTELLGNYVD